MLVRLLLKSVFLVSTLGHVLVALAAEPLALSIKETPTLVSYPTANTPSPTNRIVTVDNLPPAMSLSLTTANNNNSHLSLSQLSQLLGGAGGSNNDSYSFDYDLDVQRFLIRFVIEQLSHHSRLDLTGNCLDAWFRLRANLIRSYYDTIRNKSSYWSLRVIDSYGKSPSGFLKYDGAYFWAGDYAECVRIKEESSWIGKYCVLDTGLTGPKTHYHKVFKVGMCMPESCTDEDVHKLVNKAYETFPRPIRELLASVNKTKSIECKQKVKPLTPQAIVAISIVSVFLSLVFFATIGELLHVNLKSIQSFWPKLKNKKKESNEDIVRSEINISMEQVPTKKDDAESHAEKKKKTLKQKSIQTFVRAMRSFSAYSNAKKIFNQEIHPRDIHCLHAIRFLSQYWIIISHSYFYVLPYLDNTEHFHKLNDQKSNGLYYVVGKLVYQGYLAVDSFFVMNGLLTSYIGLKWIFKDNFKFNPAFLIKFFVHRYIRLTPVYMIVFMLHVTLSPYLGHGPMYPNDGFEAGRCANDWWTHLLYVNNLVMVDDCFGHSWYLACEMQISIVMPFLLYFFKIKIWKTNLGVLGTLLLIIANIVSVFTISYTSNLDYKTYDHFIYIAPWGRIGASLVGLLLGYILFNVKRKQKVVVIKRWVNLTCWSLVVVAMASLAVIFNYAPDGSDNITEQVLISIYQSVFRLVWSASLCYIIYTCATSNGGIVNKMASWSFWKPLSKLTYSTYLVHVSVIYFTIYQWDAPSHKNEVDTVSFFMSNVLYSYGLGFLVSLIIELPVDAIEKQFIFKGH